MIADVHVLIIPLQVMFWYMYTLDLQTKLRNELSIVGIPLSLCRHDFVQYNLSLQMLR